MEEHLYPLHHQGNVGRTLSGLTDLLIKSVKPDGVRLKFALMVYKVTEYSSVGVR